MSRSLNSVSFTGYLGGDPRTHTFDDGSRVANLSVAIARQEKQDGEWVDNPVWVDVAVRAYEGKTGAVDAIEQYLTKGSFVAVSGSLAQPREWEDKDGNTRFTICIDRASVTFGPKVDEAPASASAARAKAKAAPKSDDFDDDSIPF